MNSNSFIRVQVRVQKKYFFEFEAQVQNTKSSNKNRFLTNHKLPVWTSCVAEHEKTVQVIIKIWI